MNTKYKAIFNQKLALMLVVFWALLFVGLAYAAVLWVEQAGFYSQEKTASGAKRYKILTNDQIMAKLVKENRFLQVCASVINPPPPQPTSCPPGQTGTPPACVPIPPLEEPPVIPPNDMPFVDVSKVMQKNIGFNALRVQDTAEKPTPNSDNTGQFRIACAPSHMAFDDPIVFPNLKGASHHHTFFGNTMADANSTNASLAATGNSTCNGGIMNRSGYWIPSMIDTSNGTPIAPKHIMVYYKTDRPAHVTVPPAGLRIIAGNSKSKLPQDESVVRYTCNDDYNTRKLHIPACSAGTSQALLRFPSCWDGKNLDSPNHQDHMAYSGNFGTANRCPATHPVLIPDITFIAHWTVASSTANWRLASDNYKGGTGGNSLHGDWMNGWNEMFMAGFVNNCLKKGVDCHAHLLGDGRMFY